MLAHNSISFFPPEDSPTATRAALHFDSRRHEAFTRPAFRWPILSAGVHHQTAGRGSTRSAGIAKRLLTLSISSHATTRRGATGAGLAHHRFGDQMQIDEKIDGRSLLPRSFFGGAAWTTI
jgi:hypothetical protein